MATENLNVVEVPDIEGPTQQLCYKQCGNDGPAPMYRCDRAKGHLGLHSWELVAEVARLRELLEEQAHGD